jgi:hypothetical protein
VNSKWRLFLTIYHLLFTIYRASLSRVILNHETLPELWQVALLEIEVCSRDDAFAVVGGYPVNNLWRIRAQVCRVIFVERVAILFRENPNMGELTVTNELEVTLERRTWPGRGRGLRAG